VPPHWNVNLRVAGVDDVIARATELGGTLFMGPIDTPGLRNAVLQDPQGAVFSISAIAG
jgi:predicted enzyme related to lactoylglutathione lyase